MKHLRKSILTLLALTLFGGAGAWAQAPEVTEITLESMGNGWEGNSKIVSEADFPGFVAVDSALAATWADVPQTGMSRLYYGFTQDGKIKYIVFDDGQWFDAGESERSKSFFYNAVYYGTRSFYTTGPVSEIELTKSGANQWTLGQTPDYDVELQVEYYEAHALKEIPAGWTVKVNGVEQQTPYEGDSLMITETDSVTLVPAGNPRRVKSVTLSDETPQLQTVHIGGNVDATFYYLPGETWGDAINANRPENAGFSIDSSDIFYNGNWIVIGDYDAFIDTSTPVDPNADYRALYM